MGTRNVTDKQTRLARKLPAGEAQVDVNDVGEMRTLARGGLISLVGLVANAVLGFLFVAIVSRTLSPSEAGALFEAIAIFLIATNTTELGADTGLLRFGPTYRERKPADLVRLMLVALLPSLVVSSIVSAVLLLLAPQLSHVFFHHVSDVDSVNDIRILAWCLPFCTLTTVLLAGTRAWSIIPNIVIQYMILPASRPALLALVSILGVTPILAALAYGVPTGATFVAALVILILFLRTEHLNNECSAAGTNGEVTPVRQLARLFWAFCIPRSFTAAFQVLISWLDVLLVGALASARDAAAYTVASRYLLLGTFALNAVSVAIAPQISKLMDFRNYNQVSALYTTSTAWIVMLSWPPLLVLTMFSPLFMSIFGHGYALGDAALSILAFSMLANAGTGANMVVLAMAGRSGVNLFIVAATLVPNVVLNLILIPRLGIDGAAIAWMTSIVLTAMLTTTLLWRLYGMSPLGHGFTVVVTATTASYGLLGLATRLLFGMRVVPFLVFATVSSVLYVLILARYRHLLGLSAFAGWFARRGTVGPASIDVAETGRVQPVSESVDRTVSGPEPP
jgi:O-antigen/teichoic acid export membrane protein